MAWTDWAYQIGPVGGPYTDLSDICISSLIVAEFDAPKRGSNVPIPYKDGEYSDPFKFRDAGTYIVDCVLRYTNSSGTVTHADGAAGHVIENLQTLKKLADGGGSLIAVRRTAPHLGNVEAISEYLGGISYGDTRVRQMLPMRLTEGSWRAQTASQDIETGLATAGSYTIATGGDTDIGDATFTFTCTAAGANPALSLTTNGDKISLNGSFATSDVIVVNLRDSIFTLNGVSTAVVRKNRAWFMRLPHGQAALGLTWTADSGTWTVQIDWNDRWL